MNVIHHRRRWFGFMLWVLLWSCAPMGYDRLIPNNYTPSFQNGLNAYVEVAVGPKTCIYSPSFQVSSENFKKALLETAGRSISAVSQNQKYTLLVKNISCCLQNNNVNRTPCTAKSYWGLKDNSTGHLIWQQYVEETGIGTFHIDGGKRIKEAIANSAKQTIEAGLTALSLVDLTAAEKEVPQLAERWRKHHMIESFDQLYAYLFYSAYKHIERDRDGYHYDLYGELMAAPTKHYVLGLIGDPDNILPGSENNQTLEWRFEENGEAATYRITFFQNQMTGGTIRRKK